MQPSALCGGGIWPPGKSHCGRSVADSRRRKNLYLASTSQHPRPTSNFSKTLRPRTFSQDRAAFSHSSISSKRKGSASVMDLCFGTANEALHGLEAFYNLANQPALHNERTSQNIVETIQNTDSLVILPLPPGLVREKCPQIFCGKLDDQVKI